MVHQKLNAKYDKKKKFPLLGLYSKELKAGAETDTETPVFIAALLTTAKRWEQPKCPLVDEWIDKGW